MPVLRRHLCEGRCQRRHRSVCENGKNITCDGEERTWLQMVAMLAYIWPYGYYYGNIDIGDQETKVGGR